MSLTKITIGRSPLMPSVPAIDLAARAPQRQACHEMPVWELVIEVEPELAEAASAALFEAGAGGVEEREAEHTALLVVWGESVEQVAVLQSVAQRFAARTSVRELDESWRTEWTRHLGQERVSDGFVLQPLDDETPAPEGTRRIVFRPEQAFGVGSHVTTRLAARAVERACRERSVGEVLDVGTGTGVLAVIAALSGAGSVLGIDIDPVAVWAAREMAELNGAAARCRFETTPLAELSSTFELVVANLEAPTQRELAAALVRVVAPGGRLIVTGFLDEESADLCARLALGVVRREEEEGWSLLELGKPAKTC